MVYIKRIVGIELEKNMKLSDKLVSLRKEKGFTQMKVAEELEVYRQEISRWESGVSVPSTENLCSLSELYGVTVDYLMNERREWPAQAEEENKGEEQPRKRTAWLLYILIVIVVAATIIGVEAARRKPKIVSFDEVESEDWSDVSTNDIQIEW